MSDSSSHSQDSASRGGYSNASYDSMHSEVYKYKKSHHRTRHSPSQSVYNDDEYDDDGYSVDEGKGGNCIRHKSLYKYEEGGDEDISFTEGNASPTTVRRERRKLENERRQKKLMERLDEEEKERDRRYADKLARKIEEIKKKGEEEDREMEQQFPFYKRDGDRDDDNSSPAPGRTKKLPPNFGDEMSDDEIIGSRVEFEKENAVNDSKESSARASSSSKKSSRAKKGGQGKDDDDILEGDINAAGVEVEGGGKGAKESAPTKTKKKATTAKKKSTGGKKKTVAVVQMVLGSMPAKPIVQSIPPGRW